jgi:hypothetical protein
MNSAAKEKLKKTRWGGVAVGLAGLVLASMPADAAQYAEPLIGVNVVNPHRLSEESRQALLEELSRAGVRTIRVPLPSTSESQIAQSFIKAAFARGIQSLVILSLEYPPDAPIRPADRLDPHLYGGPTTSAADPELFRIAFAKVLAGFEAENVRLAGFELGNEINWAAFNQDFPIPGEQRVLSFTDLQEHPEGKLIAAGFRKYVETLAVLRAIRDRSALNRTTPIIVAGLADPGPAGPRPGLRADAVSIEATIRFLRVLGADHLADAFGIHYYRKMPAGTTVEQYAVYLGSEPLASCERGIICWVTEWGIENATSLCPLDDSARVAEMRIARGAYDSFISEGRVGALFYFAWNSEPWSSTLDPLSIFRCGSLTEAGRIALEPYRLAPP